MRIRWRGRVAMLTAAMTVATWLAGWWGVGLLAAVWGWVGRPWEAAVSAALAWTLLLAARAVVGGGEGALLRLAERVGGLVGAPGWAALAFTALFAGLLAWGGATLVAMIPRPRVARPGSR